jgi:hypothetical protein
MIDALREHYTSAVGAEPHLHVMTNRSGKQVDVFEWPAGTSRLGDLHFYASAGASPPTVDQHQHAVELFTGVNRGGQDILEAFTTMTLNVRESGTRPQHAVFVTGDWRIIPGLKFTSWILTERPDAFMPTLDLGDAGHVVFLDAIPVFPEEAQYRHNNRTDDLFEIWEQTEMDSWDLGRSLPTGIQPASRSFSQWARTKARNLRS